MATESLLRTKAAPVQSKALTDVDLVEGSRYTVPMASVLGADARFLYPHLPIVAATGLRPEEWAALERRDIDRSAGVLSVRRTVSGGEVVDLGKTTRSLRQVPLSPRALTALDALPPRLDSRYLIPA